MKRHSGLTGLLGIVNYMRAVRALGALALWAVAVTVAHAQFRPIPNYVGIGAGAQFRNDINNHLSGAAAVAPRIVSLPLAQLPIEQDGQEYWCSNCQQTNPCQASGQGALALGSQGQWSCTSGASLANGFPLSVNVSAAAHRIQSLAPNSAIGDALSQGQSHLNDLTTATANYNMGANRLQNLTAATTAGDAIGYGQSGASLNGLNLNNNALSGMAPGTASGQALAFAQGNAQLTSNNAAISVVSSSEAGPSATPVTITAPANIAAGRALVLVMGAGGTSPAFTLPTGFSTVRTDTGTGSSQNWSQVVGCKTATGSEPGSYSISFTGGASSGTGAILQLSNTDCAHLDANSGGFVNSALSYVIPLLTATQTNEYVLAAGSNACADVPGINTGQVFVSNATYGRLAMAGYLQAAPGSSLSPVLGPLSSTDCAPSTMAGAQLAFIPNSTVQAAPLVTNQVGAQIQSLTASVNNVLNVMAPPYHALGDGNTDDTVAIQTAIDNSFGYSANPSGAVRPSAARTVYLPVPPVCYMHSKPLRIFGATLEFKGDTGTALCQNYTGDAIIQNGWGSGNLPYAAALVGSGNSLVSSGGNPPESVDLARVLNGTGGNNLNTRFAAGFNIAFFDKVTSGASGQILTSTQAYPGTGNGAFQISFNGSNQVSAKVNTVSAGLINVGTCTAQTTGTVYEVELDWDGSTYRLWQGIPGGTAASCGTQASSNRMTQSVFEDMSLPANGPHEFWPDGSSYSGNPAFVGDLDSVRFEAQSVHTSVYTVPSAKFTADGYTDLLVNFDTSLDGTQIGYSEYGGVIGGIPNNIYLTVLDTGGSIGDTGLDNIHDLELCSIANGGSTHWNNPDGLFAIYGNGSKWTNLSCSNATYVQADFFNNDYLTHLDNWNGSGGHLGLNFGAAWNDSSNTNAQIDNTDVVCEVYQGGGGGDHEDYHSRCVDRGKLYYAWIENQSQAAYYYPFVDQEATNNNFVATFLLNDPAQPYVFIGGNIDTRNAAPYIQQDNGGYGSIFLGMTFNTFGISVAAPEIINYTNGSPVSPTQLINTWNPTGVALSNQAGNPNILALGNGPYSLMQSLELQQVPKFDNGLNHVMVNPIADPAPATISVSGSTASTAYGPYFLVCHDGNGGITLPAAASNTVANGPATLSGSNYINIAWSAVNGCATWDVLKGNTGTSLALSVTGNSYHDIGGPTNVYTAPVRNTTGDISGLAQISTGTTFAKLPGTVVNGTRIYCSNCDPPANPPVTCTSSGTRTGAFADGVGNQWLCAP
jgi:hypothetical protein